MKKRAIDKPPASQIDLREQPFNAREVGPIDRVQLPLDNITSLHGIVFDIDRDHFHSLDRVQLKFSDPKRFAVKTLVPMLDRHHALRGAEVRDTGRNLHAIVWFAEPVVFGDDGQRRRWAGHVRVVQAALPIDPDQPGITALTRPVGSINSKTGRAVGIIRPGTPVPAAEVLMLSDQMVRSPFKTVMGILLGAGRVSPCPICRVEGSSLSALDREGRCYGSCGKVKLERLYEVFLAPRALASKEGAHAGG